jgi:hypothetical protein
MASVLAVVSKAIFEKQGGKSLQLGQVWSTLKYVSNNPNLRPLADGGSLFLLTVRPPNEQLWLVAVLVSPTQDDEGWSAEPNTTAARDITALLPKLKLKSGQGVHPEKGKMGMSLQTPRELVPEDVVLLGGAATGAPRKTPASSAQPDKPAPAAPPAAAPPAATQGVDPLPNDDEVLARMTSACAEALREAMRHASYNDRLTHVTVALHAISFPEGKVYAVPSSLSPEQQLVARFIADHVGLPSGPFALPQYQWTRQAWLEGGRRVDELVEIEIDGARRDEPIWRAIQLAKDFDKQIVSRLPLLTLMDVFVELWVGQKGNPFEYVNGGTQFANAAVTRIVRELGSEGKDWAPGAADRLLSIESEPLRKIPIEVKWPVFLALARGGVPIEPRWASLLPIGQQQMMAPTVECAKAIPEALRAEAILHALGTVLPWDAAVASIDLADAFPSEELTRWAFEHSGQNAVIPKRKLLERLAEVGKRHPVVAGTLAKLKAGKAAPIVLHLVDLLEPTSVKELSPSQQKQLRAAGKRYDNLDLSASDRLSDGKLAGDDEEGGSFKGFLEIWTVTDGASKPLYDAYLYMVDSGTIFKRGTTTRVAEIVQGGVDCKDEALREALEMAIHERPRPKRA